MTEAEGVLLADPRSARMYREATPLHLLDHMHRQRCPKHPKAWLIHCKGPRDLPGLSLMRAYRSTSVDIV